MTTLQAYGVCLAMFLEGVSSSSINVQVAAVRAELAVSAIELQLIATGFLMSYAGLLLPAGRLVDRLDRRTIFLVGLGLFAVGSLLGGLAPGAVLLVVARVVQGAGAAISAPAALALITQGLPEGHLRNRRVALYGAMGAVGFSTGLVVPGFLVAALGWRSSFLVLVPLVAAVAVLAWRVPGGTLPADQSGERVIPPVSSGPGVDWAGSAGLLVLIAGGTFLAGSGGQLPPGALVATGALVAAALALVVVRCRSAFPVGVLSTSRVRLAAVALACAFAGVLSSIYLLTLALQDWYGFDSFTTGLLVLPQPVCFALLSGIGARWTGVDRWRPPLLTGLGLVVAAIAGLGVVASMSWAGASASVELGVNPEWHGARLVITVAVAMAMIGTGLALLFPSASIAAVNAVPEELRGSTSAVLTTAQNIGGTLGIAIVTALALVPSAGRPGSLLMPMLVPAALVVIGCLAVAVAVRPPATARHTGEAA